MNNRSEETYLLDEEDEFVINFSPPTDKRESIDSNVEMRDFIDLYYSTDQVNERTQPQVYLTTKPFSPTLFYSKIANSIQILEQTPSAKILTNLEWLFGGCSQFFSLLTPAATWFFGYFFKGIELAAQLALKQEEYDHTHDSRQRNILRREINNIEGHIFLLNVAIPAFSSFFPVFYLLFTNMESVFSLWPQQYKIALKQNDKLLYSLLDKDPKDIEKIINILTELKLSLKDTSRSDLLKKLHSFKKQYEGSLLFLMHARDRENIISLDHRDTLFANKTARTNILLKVDDLIRKGDEDVPQNSVWF